MKKIIICLLLNIFAISNIAFAADHHVRAGASGNGNGSDWINAYTSLPSTLTRGDTYYIADGDYGGYNFNDAESGPSYIYIKKATSSAHGTSTGWQSSYGDGQAIFASSGGVLTFESGYWVFDGITGSGNSGHGFVVQVTGTGGNVRGIRFLAGHITIAHAEIFSDNPCGVAAGDKQDGLYTTSGGNNLTIQYCYIHDWKRCAFLGSSSSDVVIEHCYIMNTYSFTAAHGQAIQLGPGACSNYAFRYNIFRDCNGTGVIVYLDATHTNIDTYGNVFWEDAPSAACGVYATGRAIGNTSGDTANNCDIYNNTFIGLNGRHGAGGGINHNGGGSNNLCYNNVFYDSDTYFDSATTHNYNASDENLGEANDVTISSTVFTNYAGDDFTLSGTFPGSWAGTTLNSPYNEDMDGNTRGYDGTWDRGAYEYIEDAPAPPVGLRIVNTN